MHPHYATPDPSAKVRGLSGTLLVLLALRASMRVVTWLVFRLAAPSGPELTADQFDTLRMLDGALLGIENLLTLVTMIVFLVWIYRAVKALQLMGRSTGMSPGLAVGGWFIPLGNVVLPWLSVRGVLRALERGTVIAGVWWLVWLANMSLSGMHQLARQVMLLPELARAIPPEIYDQIFPMLESTFWPYFIADTAAWGLLAAIVATVRGAFVSHTNPAGHA
ncbi:MAG: DUF4328 domain-containing protein [Myxococcales bacterium]|nr:DUF4328 domain-containing protein [Myxococcales bacterium]MCB9719000.1 DUF4328 domain-containing protein [Myxococcales bacterium]